MNNMQQQTNKYHYIVYGIVLLALIGLVWWGLIPVEREVPPVPPTPPVKRPTLLPPSLPVEAEIQLIKRTSMYFDDEKKTVPAIMLNPYVVTTGTGKVTFKNYSGKKQLLNIVYYIREYVQETNIRGFPRTTNYTASRRVYTDAIVLEDNDVYDYTLRPLEADEIKVICVWSGCGGHGKIVSAPVTTMTEQLAVNEDKNV